jgi:non-ribosomal peptide synthetase component F
MRSAATLSRDATTRSLLDIFHATAVRCPDRVAIDAGDARLTYRDLAERARLLAARLSATGVRPGDLVAVQVASGTSELYLAILGVLESGAAYAPIDADDPPGRAVMAIVPALAELGPWIARRGITLVSTVPTLVALRDESALTGVRLLILAARRAPSRSPGA